MSCELLSHCLTLLERQGQCLSTTQLFLQHDNTCREFKNNHGVRWMISQVFSKNIDRIQANYLRSGHTHEDVDQCFGQLSKYLLKCRDLQNADDVKAAITGFLSQCKMPFEGERHCVFVNDPRDWTLDCAYGLRSGIQVKILTTRRVLTLAFFLFRGLPQKRRRVSLLSGHSLAEQGMRVLVKPHAQIMLVQLDCISMVRYRALPQLFASISGAASTEQPFRCTWWA